MRIAVARDQWCGRNIEAGRIRGDDEVDLVDRCQTLDVLDRFFAEYTSVNSFTETVIESAQRGIVKRWPPRAGNGESL